ncbi:MAG: histidine kinase [Spirochaetales bacterium]|nr:histidine kinase [Spirochaetales bacterium]
MYSEVMMLVSVDLISIIGELIVLSNSIRNKKDVGQPVFNTMIASLIIVTFTDLLSWFCMVVKTNFGIFVGSVAGFCNYLFPNVSWWIWLIYAYSFISLVHTRGRAKAFFFCSSFPTLLSFVCLIINFNTGIFFSYVDGVYTRGDYYWINTIFSLTYIIWFIILMVMDYRRTEDKKHKKHILYLFGFCILPVLGLLSEQIFFGMYFAPAFSFLGVLMIYINVQKERITDAEAEKEAAKAELEGEKVKVMLSQIKPHFLFNTLNIIRSLITRSPNTAVEAIDHFADYLRENMTSLENVRCVSFTEELHHVENYLYIEKLRFQDHISVEYDINCVDFLLPPLSLQILVENAVKHGISPKEENGYVKIRTTEDSDFFMVVCEDNGVGFDTDKKFSNDHVGLRNTRMRLHTMCNGELVITSTPNVGTKAVMLIPKRQK